MTPEQFTQLRRSISNQLAAYLDGLFRNLGSWHDPDADQFAFTVVPLVQGSQQTLASLVALYVASQASQAAGVPVPTPLVPAAAIYGLRGVDAHQVYRRPFVAVWRSLSKGDDLATAVDRGADRLHKVAEGDMQQTHSVAVRAAMRALPTKPTGWRRVLTGTEDCEMCVAASSRTYSVEHLNPLHHNCVPGTALVRARAIEIMTRRRYSGELAVISVASGGHVSVTPNHPVLTDRGWVLAGQVGPGDHLVRSGGSHRAIRGGPDEGDAPTFADEVWRSLAVTFGFTQMPLSAEDFHGDGADGEVDVIRTDGRLSAERNPFLHQVLSERSFVDRGGCRMQLSVPSSTTPLVHAGRPASSGSVSCGGLLLPLLGAEFRSSDSAGAGSAASWYLGSSEPALDNGSADPLLVRDDVLRDSVIEVVGPQAFNRVTDVRRLAFSGHVFNFQTRSGTYESDNHIVHNCDCRVDPIFDPAHVSNSDPSGYVIDHGELGPLLVRPQDSHLTSADLPT